jgi:UDP-2-acetamido-3-amino-2,3-dideoxy-glucuronate N-acetyltransferase
MNEIFIHETAFVDQPTSIGLGTKIWHFSHVMPDVTIGQNCIFGQNVFVASKVIIGSGVKVQNNVSIYEGVVLEDDVFCGPSMVFTNVLNPRSTINRKTEYKKTLVKKSASIGANATIVCGVTIGAFAFIGAGAVVTKDVPDYGLVTGVPGRVVGYMSKEGSRLEFKSGVAHCSLSNQRYRLNTNNQVEMIP